MPSVLISSDREEVKSALASQPRFTDAQVIALYNWVVRLVTALLNYVTYFIGDNSDRIDSLQQKIQELETSIANQPTQSTPTPHQPQHPPHPSRLTRCQRCHALGHGIIDCRTKDPVTIKKRVANNQKAKKEAQRQSQAPDLGLRPPVYYPHLFADPTIPPSSSNQAMVALAADAKELRRRKMQSTRDKRRKGAPSTTV
jgi:hypothetical protein